MRYKKRDDNRSKLLILWDREMKSQENKHKGYIKVNYINIIPSLPSIIFFIIIIPGIGAKLW